MYQSMGAMDLFTNGEFPDEGPVSDPSITLHLGGVVVYFVGAGLERSYCIAGILEIALRALFCVPIPCRRVEEGVYGT